MKKSYKTAEVKSLKIIAIFISKWYNYFKKKKEKNNKDQAIFQAI